MLVGMNSVLGDIPLTVKFRMGIAKDELIAHKFIPRFAHEWGVSAMTVRIWIVSTTATDCCTAARTNETAEVFQGCSESPVVVPVVCPDISQNWAYIKQCVEALHASAEETGLPAPPMFGNGDCFSAQQYYEEMEQSGVDGVMVARGALIKPWIFTEIKERREWDISATERLEGIKKVSVMPIVENER
jgi:tRNA-dihydrouridine synthase 3